MPEGYGRVRGWHKVGDCGLQHLLQPKSHVLFGNLGTLTVYTLAAMSGQLAGFD